MSLLSPLDIIKSKASEILQGGKEAVSGILADPKGFGSDVLSSANGVVKNILQGGAKVALDTGEAIPRTISALGTLFGGTGQAAQTALPPKQLPGAVGKYIGPITSFSSDYAANKEAGATTGENLAATGANFALSEPSGLALKPVFALGSIIGKPFVETLLSKFSKSPEILAKTTDGAVVDAELNKMGIPQAVQDHAKPAIIAAKTPDEVKNILADSYDAVQPKYTGGKYTPPDAYNAHNLSNGATNSLLNDSSGKFDKPDRFTGKGYSYNEAKTGLAENGSDLKGRIILGKDGKGNIILKDGTHLLEAYRDLRLPVPKDKVVFEDGVTSAMFNKKGLPNLLSGNKVPATDLAKSKNVPPKRDMGMPILQTKLPPEDTFYKNLNDSPEARAAAESNPGRFGGTMDAIAKSTDPEEISRILSTSTKVDTEDIPAMAEKLSKVDSPRMVNNIVEGFRRNSLFTKSRALDLNMVKNADGVYVKKPRTSPTTSSGNENVVQRAQKLTGTLEKSLKDSQGLGNTQVYKEASELKASDNTYKQSVTRPIDNKQEAVHNIQLFSSADDAPPFTSPEVHRALNLNLDELKDISGFTGQTRDVYRNFKEVFGKNFAKAKNSLLDPFDRAKGAFVDEQSNLLNGLDDNVVSKFDIKKGSKESAAIMDYGEGKISKEDLAAKFGKAKAENIVKAAEWFRHQYDTMLDEVNRVRAKIYPNNPNRLIPKRQNYFRHFQEMSEGLAGLKNIFETPSAISPALSGISPFTKPKSKFLSFAQKRFGDVSKRDAVGGYLDYTKAFSYAKHIDPHIGNFRSLAKELAEGTEKTRHINNFIEYLQDYANDLAGKTNPADRYIQKIIPFGRQAFKTINWLNSRIKANTILGNLSSSIAQIFNVPQGIGSAKQHSVYGAARTLGQIFDKDTAMNGSNFIKERYSGTMYDKFDTGMLKNTKKAASWITGVLDEVGTKFIWNSHYEKAVREGINNPIKFADDRTRALVAGRGVGEVPLIQKSKVFQLVAPFQLEVGNLWHVMKDFVSAKDFSGLATTLVASYLMNRVAEKVRGSDVTFDPIEATYEAGKLFASDPDKKKGALKAGGRLAGEVLSNIPLGQTVASLYPEYGFKLNNYQLPTRKDFFGEGDPTKYGTGVLALKGLQDPLFKVVPPFGGGQVEKTYKAAKLLREGVQTNAAGNVEYQAPKSPLDIAKSLAFGPSASPEAQTYYDKMAGQATKDEQEVYPFYQKALKLQQEGKNDEAQVVVDSLGDKGYDVYKKIVAKEKTKVSTEAKKEAPATYQKLKKLVRAGKKDEANQLLNSLTDAQYKAYESFLKQMESK